MIGVDVRGITMATDEERRKIVETLREIDEESQTSECIKNGSASTHLIVLSEAVGRPKEQTLWGRLADLIEPEPERTCHDYGGAEGTNGELYDFACDECGFACDTPQPNYCPGCGARVVEE